MKRIILFFLMIVFLTSTLLLEPVLALMKTLSVAEIAGESQLVCRGKVKSVVSQWNDEGNFIWTFVTLNVLETIKGKNVTGKDVTLKVPDGVVGDIVQRSSEQVSFAVGEEAVVFLKDEIHKGFPYFKVVGRWQGKFAVKAQKVKGKPLKTFVEEVKKEIASEE